MCLALPCRVVAIAEGDGDKATIDVSGMRKEISLALLEDVVVGDYVIVHVGYALTKLDPEEAEKTLALFAEMGEQALLEAPTRAATLADPYVTDAIFTGLPPVPYQSSTYSVRAAPATRVRRWVPPPPGSAANLRFVCTNDRVGGSNSSAPVPRKAIKATWSRRE